MYLLTNTHITAILHNLSTIHLNHLHDALATSLAQFSAQQNSPNPTTEIHQPQRSHFVTSRGITTLTMPVSDTSSTGVKVVTLAPGSAAQGAITIYEAEGALLGVLNAEQITAFRTALASMIALKLHVRDTHNSDSEKEKKSVVVFGAGKQAEWHVRLVLRVLGAEHIARITVVNRGRERLSALERGVLNDLRGVYPSVRFETLEHDPNASTMGSGNIGSPDSDPLRLTLFGADIIFCTTPSIFPLFSDAYLKDETTGRYNKQRFIALIGSYRPDMQEIDSDTILGPLAKGGNGKIVVDSREACLVEAGELLRARVSAGDLVEVGELWTQGRENAIGNLNRGSVEEGGNVIFKCVGMALMDMVVGKALIEIARELGVGMEVTDF
ncbi:ornithine cyclodeaminase/mu-crystallin family protein [Melanomma pulvis-pyrius CBS 109.77]|uniref:Ornithine cyclodeaminase/mu-crystallin family protein n=1 Tax=Melanomma pulvis-pyrius CBS 109.77 TaxID=1314802 RepID=A0A6A6XIJ5_9PLEO|nr:ornithine cyclodeaminase/mu-crystallin family protein [Melanomma pulvis-pyrius CBS 109.77]